MNGFPEDHDFEIVFSREFDIITKEVDEYRKKSVLKALNKLSRRQKEAIVLRFYDNLSYKEIGDLLSISIKSTYTLIYRAVDVLKYHVGKLCILLICLL